MLQDFHDDEYRAPCSKQDKTAFSRACELTGKKMAPVIRDLTVSYTQAFRNSHSWPASLETPNYKQILQAAINLVIEARKMVESGIKVEQN